MATRVAIELSDREIEQLDRVVSERGFESREAALRAAVQSTLLRVAENDIADSYRRAYEGVPEDEVWGEVGLRLAADSIRAQRG